MSSSKELVIRDVLPSDAEGLRRFWLELSKEMYKIERYIVPSPKNAETWLSYVLGEVKEGRSKVLVAQKQSELVGFVHLAYVTLGAYETSTKIAAIDDMYVKPDYRSQGVGTMLMREILEKVKDRDVKQVRLSVLSENLGAVRFYEKHGFRVYRHGMIKEIR